MSKRHPRELDGTEKMRRIITIILFISTVLLFSCEELDSIVQCQECVYDEPQAAELRIKTGSTDWIIYGSKPVVIRIYEGNLEDDILMASFTTTSDVTSYTVSLNKKYTVTATYKLGDNTYIAVDSVVPGVKYIKNQCDEPCYYVYGRTLNLRLKYTGY